MKTIKSSAAILSQSPYRLYIKIEGDLPKGTNKLLGAHFRQKHNNAVKWKRLVAMAVESLKPEKQLAKFHISATRHNYRHLDFDSCVASLKPVVDGLKGLIIKDDTWAMTGPWRVTQEFRSKKDGPMLEVWISEKEDLGSPN